MNRHIVLLGDSIFDNAFYVPGGPAVIDQVRSSLPPGDRATLGAVDGARVASVDLQLERLPADATHLVLSVGGNDALWMASQLFAQESSTVQHALQLLAETMSSFKTSYRDLIVKLRELNLPLVTCTIYDSIPGLKLSEATGLCVFNDVITRTAFEFKLPLIDLRTICREASDYSPLSPIEPSVSGGRKIASAILDALSGGGQYRTVVA